MIGSAIRCLAIALIATAFICSGTIAVAQPAPAAPATKAPTNPKAAEAKAALDAKDSVSALKAILEMHRATPDAWRGNVELIDLIYRAAIDEARGPTDKPDRMMSLANLLNDPANKDLFKKIYPDENTGKMMTDLMRNTAGKAHWLLGNLAQIRGNRDEAHQEFNQASLILVKGDPFYARMCASLGSIFMEKGAEAVRNKDTKNITPSYEQAAMCFVLARDNAGAEKTILNAANAGLAQIANMGLQIQVEGLPAPAVVATPTPQPGLASAFKSGGIASFFASLSKDKEAQQRGFMYLALAFGVIVIYWVIPIWLMRRTMLKGNVRAAELLPMVKFLGPFTFLGLVSGFKFERQAKGTTENSSKQPCPNCGFNLGDMYA
ncbi:MAG: hypothetical protein ABI579_01790 [Candidatus Sumerlaeota bacterium]